MSAAGSRSSPDHLRPTCNAAYEASDASTGTHSESLVPAPMNTPNPIRAPIARARPVRVRPGAQRATTSPAVTSVYPAAAGTSLTLKRACPVQAGIANSAAAPRRRTARSGSAPDRGGDPDPGEQGDQGDDQMPDRVGARGARDLPRGVVAGDDVRAVGDDGERGAVDVRGRVRIVGVGPAFGQARRAARTDRRRARCWSDRRGSARRM